MTGGHEFPEFRFPVLNEGYFAGDTTFLDSSDLRGKVVLAAWWATWCAPCIEEQPSLLALQEEFGDDGLVVLSILHEDSPRRALEWMLENDRLQLNTVVGTRAFARASRVGGLPNTVLVNREGTVTELFLGYWRERDPYVRNAVRELLHEGSDPS